MFSVSNSVAPVVLCDTQKAIAACFAPVQSLYDRIAFMRPAPGQKVTSKALLKCGIFDKMTSYLHKICILIVKGMYSTDIVLWLLICDYDLIMFQYI